MRLQRTMPAASAAVLTLFLAACGGGGGGTTTGSASASTGTATGASTSPATNTGSTNTGTGTSTVTYGQMNYLPAQYALYSASQGGALAANNAGSVSSNLGETLPFSETMDLDSGKLPGSTVHSGIPLHRDHDAYWFPVQGSG